MGKIFTKAIAPYFLSISEKVAFLQSPEAYHLPVTSVEIKQTHMSWVFLVNGFVYKLKKPVKYRFLDLSILDARFRNCREEMRLNKRLAKDIYLGIVPLTVDEKGRPALEGSGVIIDWLVKMRRIREEQMLDYAIKHGEVNETEVRQAAVLLSDFYKGAPAMLTNPSQYRVRVRNEVQAVFLELLDPAFALPIPLVERLAGALLQYIAKQADLFDKRVQQGRIIEAHGDLRPEHICLGPIPAIIDCLEFSRELRILDTAEEVAYLAIECEFAGSKKIGELFFQVLSAVTKDAIPVSLICFYKLKRALLRALLVIRHVTEPEYKNDSQWLQKAHAYLQLAEQYLEKVGML